MKYFLRTLKYIRPYLKSFALAMLCMSLFSLMSAFSIGTIMPLVNVLFLDNSQSTMEGKIERQKNEITIKESKESLPIIHTIIPSIKERINQKLDEWIMSRPKTEALKIVCIILLIGFFLKNFFRYGQSYFMASVEQGVIRDLRNDLYEHFHRLSLSFFHKEKTGHLISRITNDVNIVNASIMATFNSIFRDPILILIYLCLLFIISPKLTLISILILPISGALIAKMGNKLKKYSIRSQEKMADMMAILQETISGIRVVKAFGMEKFEIDKFKKETNKYRNVIVKIERVRELAPPLTEYLGVILGVIILWFGGKEIFEANSSLGPGGFVLFLAALFSMLQPLKYLGQVNNSIQEGIAASERVFQILDTVPKIKDSPDAIEIDDIKSQIEFNNVSFSYEGEEREAIDNISLRINKGETVALVGPSGSGKSTLVDLLARFYTPQSGTIKIDGYDLEKIKLKSLRNLMGIVTQETILFNDTVFNNIAYGLRDISFEQVENSAKAANAHQFIMELSDGYETFIGDRGVKLSGGERQRLAIARAILKNPPLIIFDEATSSLDTQSEILVQSAIENLLKGRTAIVIAHRLSTIQHSNKIIVIEKGKIVQQGTHQELMQQEGLYKTLYNLQFRM